MAAIVVVSFAYAAWNRGLGMTARLVSVQHATDGFVPDGLSDDVTRQQPFELDRLRVKLLITSSRGTRGPASASGNIGQERVAVATGVVGKDGHSGEHLLQPHPRGPVAMTDWWLETGDPLGLFSWRIRGQDGELALMLPRFASLHAQPLARELEASVTAPRAGAGTEVFGVRQYQPGDPLRRIHWRSTARRGELIVREFEPPGVQNLGIFLDPNPPGTAEADQIARIAASEAWDCLRAGGRVTLWAPGCEPTGPAEERNLLALLEWLARYPKAGADDASPPLVGAVVAVTSGSDRRLLDAVDDVRAHGGPVRAWVVGDAVLASDIEVEHAGLGWPL